MFRTGRETPTEEAITMTMAVTGLSICVL